MAGSGSWRRGQSYSQALRDRVLDACEVSSRAAARRFGVSESYVIKARARLRETGERQARAQRNQVAPRLAGCERALIERIRAVPDATLDELRAWLRAEQAAVIGRTALWKGLARLGLTLKKTPPGERAGQALPRPGPARLGRDAAHTGPASGGVHR